MYGTDNDFTPNPNAMARRSISIFSRRGTETPEPKPPFIAQAAMKTPRQMTERQKSWLGRRRSVSGCSSPNASSPKATGSPKPKGTVLNAVPSAKTIKMTALEEEMATSPNEEILTAVSESSPTQFAWTAHSRQTSPTQQTSFWNRSTASLTQRTKSERRKETQTRIGMWVNGITQWDDQFRHRAASNEPNIEEETGFTPLRPGAAAAPSTQRPYLSVVIPSNEPKVNNMSLSTIVQPRPRKPIVSVAPAEIVSKFNIAPTITVEEAADIVSPLEAELVRATPPPERQLQVSDNLETTAVSQERPKASRSSSSTSSMTDRDDGSVCSKHSSATSIDVAPALTKRSSKRLSGRVLTSKPKAEGQTDQEDAASRPSDINKPLPPNPIPVPRRSAPVAPATSTIGIRRDKRPRQSRSMRSAPGGSEMLQPMRPTMTRRSLSQLDREFMRTSPYVPEISESVSPTLSQAENALQERLSHIDERKKHAPAREHKELINVDATNSGCLKRNDSVRSVMQPPEHAPTLPKRSRKRDWYAPVSNERVSQLATVQALARRRSESEMNQLQQSVSGLHLVGRHGVHRSMSAADMAQALSRHDFAQLLPMPDEKIVVAPELTGAGFAMFDKPTPSIIIDDGLVVVAGPTVMAASAAAAAEDVLLHILSALTSTGDLFNTAVINKGMYRVYKENEMQLIRQVVLNQSVAAWEFREWSPPERNETKTSKASSQLEHTPKTYVHGLQRDVAVIESLKALILEQCQTFIRRETVFALSTPSHPNAQRFNDAFWRIWCFCKIFGCGKNREDDVTGQLDWLKGGLLANNQGCVATVNTNLDFDMGSVLLNAPDFFASGNMNGLSAQQLYDMIEIWNCLAALLQGYQGRIEQAYQIGVFEGCNISEGDVEKEEQTLEEWTFHLLTLGPAVVLEMAQFAGDNSSAGFKHARENGWTTWSPPQYNGSRATFLKEPVARLYEERVAAAALKLQNPHEQEKKEMSRKRVATLAAEIRLRRQTSSYKRLPFIDMTMERPMSVVTRQNSMMSTRSQISAVSTLTASCATSASGAPSAMAQHPMSPGAWSPRKISPIIEDRVESFNRMSLQNFAAGVADDTSELAVKRIVDMGFTAGQARHALKMTDMGDGLRVDRAVDLLLRQ